jgi:tetratricopeptide (TPR) repeat protein
MNGGSVTPDASAAQQQSSSQSASSSPSSLPSESEQQQPMQFSVRTGRAARRPIGRFPPAPPPPYDRSEESSCGSDDDLRKMMPDLLPADRAVPNLLHSMSAAQQDSDEEVEAAAEIPMRTMRQRTETPVQHQRAVPPPERPRKPGAASASPEEETETPEIDALNAKAMGYVHAGEYDHALAAFSRVLRLQLDRHGPVHPSTASAHHNLGTVHAKRAGVCPADSLQQRHCRARAMECFQAAARSARDSLGRNHPNVAVSLVRIGFLLLQSRQYHNAIVTFTEALRIRVAHYGEQHGLVANLYNNLGVCNMHLGEFEAGRKHLESAETIQRHVVASTNNEPVHLLELADTLFNIGGLCLEWIRRQGPDTRRSVRAEQAFQEALQIRTRVLGAQDPMVLQVKGLLDMARSVPRPRVRSPKQQQQQRPKSPALQHRQLPTMKEEGTREGVMEPPQVRRSVKSHEFRSPTPPIAEKASPQASSIFREKKSSSQRKRKEVQEPPVPQITVSSEGGEEKKGDEFPERKRNKGTRIFITPHFVPEMSPQRPARRPLNSSDDAVASGDNNDMSFSPDTSSEAAGAVLNQSYTYDAEESCLISDSGVDSEHGRIHYPLTWNKAGIQSNESESVTGHDIIVTRPFRAAPLTQNVGRGGGGLHGSTSTNSSKQRGSETVNFSTGNKERDDVMARARAILQAHSEQESETGEGDPPSDEGEIDDEAYDDPTTKSSAFEQDLQEDGVAPLGGHWVSKGENGRKFTRDMLKDPMNFLPEIHDEASRQLKKGNLVDAQYLFEMVLRCQRRRHGTLHPDVAAALHNVGIAQLREQNHLEALKAFEEAARVRKGSLGKDHPLVAVR